MNRAPHQDPGPRASRPGPDLHRWWGHVRHCLGWRLVLWLALSLFVLLGASTWLSLDLHREQLQSLLEERAVELGETVLSSMHHAMLQNDREELQNIITNIATSDRVLALRVIGTAGDVAVSDRQDEVGHVLDVDQPSCAFCHDQDPVRVPVSVRDGLHVYPDPEGRSILGLVVPVLNSRECWEASCHVHGAQKSLLGILDIELSTASVEASIARERRQAILLHGGTLLLLCVVTGLLAWKLVHDPFHELLEGTHRIGAGDLEHRIPVSHVGELGQLAAAFNSMAARLGTARQELEEWNRTLEARVEQKTKELRRAQETMVFTEKMVSLGRLASIVAHEINNPLAGILVSVKLLRRRLGRLVSDEAERQRTDETLAMVERETARSGDIVRNLLLFSRHREMSIAPVALTEVCARAVKLVRHQADLQQIDVHEQHEADLPEVFCDANQIEQALLAVIMNSIDAMPDGGVLGISCGRVDEGHVGVLVTDTGGGIPESIRMRVFEPFFTTKNEGQGTGLGLSVMYGIVQRHGGRVHMDSEEGHGTSVHIVLPLRPVDVADAPDPAAIVGRDTLWKDVFS